MLTTKRQRAYVALFGGFLVFISVIFFLLLWSISYFWVALKLALVTGAIVFAIFLLILLFEKILNWISKGED